MIWNGDVISKKKMNGPNSCIIFAIGPDGLSGFYRPLALEGFNSIAKIVFGVLSDFTMDLGDKMTRKVKRERERERESRAKRRCVRSDVWKKCKPLSRAEYPS